MMLESEQRQHGVGRGHYMQQRGEDEKASSKESE